MQFRYLGLELGGAKNQRTSLAVVQYFPKERKTFLLDVHQHLGPTGEPERSSDQGLIETIVEALEGITLSHSRLAANVPLTLPPCFGCKPAICARAGRCKSPDAIGGFDLLKKLSKKNKAAFTPYTQRPVEVWLRHGVLPKFEKRLAFDIDEAMGGTRAPLTSRMMFLKRMLPKIPMVETFPKLTLAALANELHWPTRWLEGYRELDGGIQFREELLEALTDHYGVFVYDRDMAKITKSLSSFDAFLCAFTAWLSDQGLCEKPPRGFPVKSGWVEYPRIR